MTQYVLLGQLTRSLGKQSRLITELRNILEVLEENTEQCFDNLEMEVFLSKNQNPEVTKEKIRFVL